MCNMNGIDPETLQELYQSPVELRRKHEHEDIEVARAECNQQHIGANVGQSVVKGEGKLEGQK